MNVGNLSTYLRNHSFLDTNIKVKIKDKEYDIKDIKYSGVKNGDVIIIEVDIKEWFYTLK